jgi:hypothetical protein
MSDLTTEKAEFESLARLMVYPELWLPVRGAPTSQDVEI